MTDHATKYIMEDIGRKWKDCKTRLWRTYVVNTCKDKLKKEAEEAGQDFDWEEYVEPPRAWAIQHKLGMISAPMWTQFVDMRLRSDMVEKSRKNSAARRTYTSPHTGGSKKLRVRGLELAAEKGGNEPSRGELYAITHTKKDRTYTDPNVPRILELTRDPTVPTFPSANDALGLVYPKEHSGRVRGMGSGVTPSQVNMSRRRGGAAGGSS
ncbi:hypothetical protein LINPERPRIM_LOCUS32855 [Linum perenne]